MTDLTKPDRNPFVLYWTFAARLVAAINACQEVAPGLAVFEAYRSPERQNWLYNQGRGREGKIVTQATAWNSSHQYGIAVDVAVKSPEGVWSWEWDRPKVQQTMFEHGIERGPRFEEAHYELRKGLSFEEMKQLNRSGGFPAVWYAIEARL